MKTDFPHLDSVHGWLNTQALIFTSLYRTKFLQNIEFSCLEIGVHHGKFFIGLENLTPRNGKAIAIDVFESQDKNIDGSGSGNLEIFHQHVSNFCQNPKRVIARSLDSLDIDVSEIGFNQFGLVSIDGGHTANHTMHDLDTSSKLVTETGLVILDDILNQDWTGVVTGAVNYFTSSKGSRIVPFAIGYNKLFCCHYTMRNRVMKHLVESRDELKKYNIQVFKLTEFAENQVISLK